MTMAELMASPHPEFRDSEDVETLRKRLVYESRKRGILEMELILSTFTKARLETMDEGELREYDRVRPLSSPPSYSHARTDTEG
jgi:succinate dehydrogenase assembly factor 2